MTEIIPDFLAYAKAVFIDGTQKFLTLFDIVGISVFLSPSLASRLQTDAQLVRAVGASVLLLSFALANFSLYRRLAKGILLIMYPHSDYTAVEMQNLGPGTAKDLKVAIIYEDEDGQEIKTSVRKFFSDGALHDECNAHVLTPDRVVYFQLPRKETVPSGRITVFACFTGAESGKSMHIEEEFGLEEQQFPRLHRARVY